MFIELTPETAIGGFPEMENLIKRKEIHAKLVFFKNGLEVTPLTTPSDIFDRTTKVYYDENYLGSFFFLNKDEESGRLTLCFDGDQSFTFWFKLPNHLRKDKRSYFMIQDNKLFFLQTSSLPDMVSLMYVITPVGPGNQERFEAIYEIDCAQAAYGGSWDDVRASQGLPPTKKFAWMEKTKRFPWTGK